MDPGSAKRLRAYGLIVVALFFIFAWPWAAVMATMEAPYKDALATTLAIGIGLLLLAEIAPLIKSLKAGGVEIEFGDSVNSKFTEFETRIVKLEWAAESTERTTKALRLRPIKQPPALARTLRRPDDPWKGRFGEQAAQKGFALSAEFTNAGKSSVQIVLQVTAPDDEHLQGLECVEFYLHDRFDPAVVPAVFHGGKAKLSLLAYGGFTVGAWIPCSDVELELDLATLPNAPPIVREKPRR